MKVSIESTTKIVTLNGVPARIWEGQTDSGIPVHAYITRISPQVDPPPEQFERELKLCRTPSAEVEAINGRLVL